MPSAWEQGSPVNEGSEEWKRGTPVNALSGNLAQMASSGSAGFLGTLDIIPQALGSLANLGTLAVTGQNPGFRPTPFRNVGRTFGVGRREPQTPAEEATGFASEMVGASLFPGGLAAKFAAPGNVMRTLGVEAAATGGAIGGGLLGQEMGGTPGQFVGTIAGGLAPAAAPFAARTLISPIGQRQMQSNLAAAQRQGIPLSAGQAAGGSGLEKASAVLPGGQRVASQFAERQSGRMGQRIDELSAGLTAREPSQEAAGRAIKEGIGAWTDDFRARGNQLYEAVHSLIPPQTPVTLSKTKDRLSNLVMDEEFSDILDAPLVRALSSKLGTKDTIPYDIAHTIRSRVGDRLSGSELIADAPKGQLKKLYSALSDDLDDLATAIGPEAERAAKRASNFWRSGMKRVDDFLDPIQKRGIPENVYKAAVSGVKEGPSRINALKKSLEPEQWNAVVGTTLRRLGRAVPSARTTGEIAEESTDFSMETFLTNLERMDVGARKALFTGSRYAGLEKGLNDLVDVAQGVRGQRQAVYNPSGTAAGVYNAAGLAAPAIAGMIDPVLAMKLGLGIGGNVALQKGLQSPSIVNWLANPTKLQPSIGGQLVRPYEALQ